MEGKLAQADEPSNYLARNRRGASEARSEAAGGTSVIALARRSEMESTMNAKEVIDCYFDMWNETDGEKRRALIAKTWTENARYVDPMLEGDGRQGIDAMVAAVHQRFPGYRFRRTSEIDQHHDRLRFSWELAPTGGPVFADGVDFGIVAADGRLEAITGFIDHAPAAPAAE